VAQVSKGKLGNIVQTACLAVAVLAFLLVALSQMF